MQKSVTKFRTIKTRIIQLRRVVCNCKDIFYSKLAVDLEKLISMSVSNKSSAILNVRIIFEYYYILILN